MMTVIVNSVHWVLAYGLGGQNGAHALANYICRSPLLQTAKCTNKPSSCVVHGRGYQRRGITHTGSR